MCDILPELLIALQGLTGVPCDRTEDVCGSWQYEVVRKVTPEIDGDAWILADYIPIPPGTEAHVKVLCAGCGGQCTITKTKWPDPVFADKPICTMSCKRCAIKRGLIPNCPKED